MSRARMTLLPLLVLSVALGTTWLVWDHERQATQKALHSQFDFSLREAVSRVDQRMAAYEQMLRGVQGLVATSGMRNIDTFRDYVAALQLDANFSGIQVLGIAEHVPPARLAEHLAAMGRLGYKDYAIRPPGQRDAYAPVIQHEPQLNRHRAVPGPGFDPWSDPARRLAMERARDSGMVALSGKVRLEGDEANESPSGFVMYLPIYERNQPHDSVTERREHLAGWVFASFHMQHIMASLYGEQAQGFAVTIYDGVEPTEAALLFRSAENAALRRDNALTANEYLVVGGHTWTLSLRAQKDFEKHFGGDAAMLIAAAGLGLSLLLAALTWLMASGWAEARRLAAGMTRDLRESEQRWAFALEGAGDGVWDWNLRNRTAIHSRRWQEIVGSAADSIDDWQVRIHPDECRQVLDTLQDCLDSPPDANLTWVAEYRILCHDMHWKWVLSRGMVAERGEDGLPLRLIGTLSDISERKALDERIRYMAQYDTLTDLPNRALFFDRVQSELARARRHNEYFALIFLDLDHFKPINDNFGHAVGDHLLRKVALRLTESVRKSDTVGRIGGDEFVVLIPELARPEDARILAGNICDGLRRPFAVDGHTLTVSCSVGVSIYPRDGDSAISLTKSADEAMYRVKAGGRDGVRMAETA